MTKYIFVTGGVVSGLGKGITACITRTSAESPRPKGDRSKTGSLHQC